MEKKNQYLIIVGIAICIIIACLSPFIASSNPDGLEKSAEDAKVSEDSAYLVIEPPFPDYTMGDSKIGEIIVLALGGLITLAIGLAVAFIVRKNKN